MSVRVNDDSEAGLRGIVTDAFAKPETSWLLGEKNCSVLIFDHIMKLSAALQRLQNEFHS